MAFISHVQAAVDGPYLSGYIGGLVGAQETHDPSNLLRPAEPTDRDLPPDAREHIVRNGGEHVRGDESGGYRVHREAEPVAHWPVRAVELEDGLLGQRLRQAEQSGLGRCVIDLADIAGLADDR